MENIKFKKPVYENLEIELAKRGLNYVQFGKLIGVNGRTMNSRMNGKSQFKLPEIDKALELFGKKYEELFRKSV